MHSRKFVDDGERVMGRWCTQHLLTHQLAEYSKVKLVCPSQITSNHYSEILLVTGHYNRILLRIRYQLSLTSHFRFFFSYSLFNIISPSLESAIHESDDGDKSGSLA